MKLKKMCKISALQLIKFYNILKNNKKEYKMIFTECPYCSESQVFGWESSMPTGWFPSKCHECKNVMWVQATSICGETITSEEFKVKIMQFGDEDKIDQAIKNAENLSTIVYE